MAKRFKPRTGKQLDAHIEMCDKNKSVPHLKGHEEFRHLWETGRIRPNYSAIRTMYNRGGCDGGYFVDFLGRLYGMEAGMYSGKEGTFNPEDILSLEKSPDGWELNSLRLRKRNLTAIVTGFEPFGSYDFNPTMDAAKRFDGKKMAGIHVYGLVIPATYGAFNAISDKIVEIKPDMILSVGFASMYPSLTLEMRGKNEMFSKYADANGMKPDHKKIVAGGKRYLNVNTDAETIAALIADAGIPVEVSEDADTFICNSMIYNAMHSIINGPNAQSPIHFAFMHTPGTDEYSSRKGMEKKKTMPQENLDMAIAIALHSMADEIEFNQGANH